MRKISEIILHCTATEAGKPYTVFDIDRWHKERGFLGIGYHYVIYVDGTLHKGRNESAIGAHCSGHNLHSIGIAYVGGLLNGKPANTLNSLQIDTLKNLLRLKMFQYGIDRSKVYLHCELAKKDCPCFDRSFLDNTLLKD